jgi:iron(III) transport system permease protein
MSYKKSILPSASGMSGERAIGRPPSRNLITKLRLRRSFFYYILAVLLAIIVLYPMAILLLSSFFTGQPGRWGHLTLNGYTVWLQAGEILPIVINSLVFASARLCIGLFFSLLFAWSVARTDVPFPGLMAWLIPIPFFVPDLLTGISWLMMGNPQNGLINQWARSLFGIKGNVIDLYGWTGLIFHASLGNIAFMFLMLVGFFKSMDASFEEAAITLGANKLKTLFTITLPIMKPAIISVAILVFVQGLESFESPLLFGNPGGVYLFSNEIYRMLNFRYPPEYGSATALAVFIIFVMTILLIVKQKLTGNRQYAVVTGKGHRPTLLKLPNLVRWAIFSTFVVYFMLAVVIPVTQIVISSFFPIFGLYDLREISLQNWRNLWQDSSAVSGIENTVLYSSLAGFGAILIGGLVGYIRVRTRHWLGAYLEFVAWAPWTLPGIVLSLALLWAWALPPEPFNLYGTATVIVLGFLIKGLPLGTATMQSSIRQISVELEESGRVHGGSWIKTVIYILAPLLRRGAFATFLIVFAMAARDLSVPLLLYRSGTETLTVTMLNYYEEGVMGTLAAIGVVQLAMVMVLLCLERIMQRKQV